MNIYIVYRLIPGTKDSSITLVNSLFGAAKLTKNADIDKYKYSGYGIGFHSRGSFSHPSGGYGRNVIILGANMSSSAHANYKTRIILVLGKYNNLNKKNFTADKHFCLSLYYNGNNNYQFVNGKEVINFKADDSEIVPYPLCLGGLSRDFDVSYMRATG